MFIQHGLVVVCLFHTSH